MIDFGPVHLRLYTICVLTGLVVWMLITARIWQKGGGDPIAAIWVCILAAPAALIGARVYSVMTDTLRGAGSSPLDFTHGGLGLYGAVAGGVCALVVQLRARRWPVGTFLDCTVLGLCLGQAIGRFGNWFNQELYGTASNLPWALHVDPAYRPVDQPDQATYHPVFLYEALWDVTVFFLLLRLWPILTRRFRPGGVAAAYLALYSVGRIVVEAFRGDPALMVAGLRINQLIGLFGIATALLVLAVLDRRRRRS
jgi:prolipoprotein diacylglyceryl transferase